MDKYFETIYFEDEFGENDYPQLLCNYISNRFFPEKGKLLDIGSGKGAHIAGFWRCGHDVLGLDKRPKVWDSGHDLPKIKAKACDIEVAKFPWRANTFDYAWSKSVVEHVHNVENFVKETLRVLKPGGRAVIMTPSWESQKNHFWDDYTHVTPWTKKGFQNWFRINGFEQVHCEFFLQLPVVWKYPMLQLFTEVIAKLTPDSWKWKDYEQSNPRNLIRFSKEKMLLVTGVKPHGK